MNNNTPPYRKNATRVCITCRRVAHPIRAKFVQHKVNGLLLWRCPKCYASWLANRDRPLDMASKDRSKAADVPVVSRIIRPKK
jgi:hypothetical protein